MAGLRRNFGYGRAQYGRAEYGRGIDVWGGVILFDADGRGGSSWTLVSPGVVEIDFDATGAGGATFTLTGGGSQTTKYISFVANGKGGAWFFFEMGPVPITCLTNGQQAPGAATPRLSILHDAPAGY